MKLYLSYSLYILLILAIVSCSSLLTTTAEVAPDAPDVVAQKLDLNSSRPYNTWVSNQKSPADLAHWMGLYFRYDTERLLKTTPPTAHPEKRLFFVPIPPDIFYRNPTGICTDLAHFGVQVLKQISPELKPFYLRMSYQPIEIRGHKVSQHWVAGYTQGGLLYFFADSKRPGYIAGPFQNLSQYLADYSGFRKRVFNLSKLFEQSPF